MSIDYDKIQRKYDKKIKSIAKGQIGGNNKILSFCKVYNIDISENGTIEDKKRKILKIIDNEEIGKVKKINHRNISGKVVIKQTELSREYFDKESTILKETRKDQYMLSNNCVIDLMNNKNISIKAEEKSGKRIIMECIHTILTVNHYIGITENYKPQSIYITALNRKDTKEQFIEQEVKYGITSIVATKVNELLGEIVKIVNGIGDSKIYIHIDECDYGTSSTQQLSTLYNSHELINHRDRIKFITYSATPEELTYSEKIEEPEWTFHEFIPANTYFGAQKYLDNNLVYEPEIFFDGNGITDHGKKIIKNVKKNCKNDTNTVKQRNIIVIRDTVVNKLMKLKEKKTYIENKYKCEIQIYDKDSPFSWGDNNSWACLGRKEIRDDDQNVTHCEYIPVLIFISQICTRSTEICRYGHRRINVWHDVRKLNDEKCYNTLSQAIGRVKHYTDITKGENNIKLYCDKDILNYTLGINLVNTPKLKIAQRIGASTTKSTEFIFEKYLDNYQDVDSVEPNKWMIGDPNNTLDKSSNIKYLPINGKYCHYDKKLRVFNDKPPGSTTHEQIKNVLQYKNRESNEYIIRKAQYIKNINYTGKTIITHQTKSSSMWTLN
jgi:hypothetical protein